MSAPCRIGLVGFGSLGQYLYAALAQCPELFTVAWVYNRSAARLAGAVPAAQILPDLADLAAAPPVDIIVEVCHPAITAAHGAAFLARAHLFLGSPTALADDALRAALAAAAARHGRSLLVPAGALWGAADLAKMGAAGSLAALRVTMKKHPLSLQLEGGEPLARLRAALAAGTPGETVLYDGPVRALALVAPNNVNTMAAAALAAANLGFDGVQARLVSDPALLEHVVIVEAEGRADAHGQRFTCTTARHNPAAPGAVTGSATYASFFASLRLAAQGSRGPGLHLI